MLEKIQKSKDALCPVPRTWERYWANIDGMVLERVAHDSYRRVMGDAQGYAIINIGNREQRVNLKNLIQLTFKPVFDEDFDFYLHANVDTIDGSKDNFVPSNLIWNFGLSHYGNEFYRIPGYSRYLINREGVVYDRVKCEYRRNVIREYVDVYASPDHRFDIGNTNSVVHRLLALAFIPYDNRVCSLDVNHIDGIKHNHQIDNLEWVTRLENIIHAVENGLTYDQRGVRVTNVKTNTITEYPSQSACASELNICKKLLSWRIRKGKRRHVFDGTYTFESMATNTYVSHRTSPKMVIVINLKERTVVEVSSIAKAAPIVGISIEALKARHRFNSLVFGDFKLVTYSPSQGESKPEIDYESLFNAFHKMSAPTETYE